MSTALDAKVLAARAVGQLARRAGRGGGTSLPGKVLTRLEPRAITRLAGRLPLGTAVISATNGKTTTAAMVASVLQGAGIALVHNRAGANMAGGIASTLLDAAGRGGTIDGDLGLFEVDEFWLDRVAPELAPRAIALGNLFRDQLDRYGELDTIADRWAALVARLPETALALNADDPLIADLGRERGEVSYFGVQDPGVATAEMQHASDSKHCRRCGTAYVYDAVYLGHLGRYRCPHCGRARPEPDVAAESIELRGTRGCPVHAAHAAGQHDHHPPPPRALQRVQRTGRGHAVSAAGDRHGDDRRRPGDGERRLRPGRADPGGRRRALAAADQEPRRRQRGGPHARAGTGRDRRARRAQRSHRRRPRRLLDLGRRSRVAVRARAPRHLRGHPRRRAGRAPEVRRRGSRPSARAAPARRGAGRGAAGGGGSGACSRCRPTRPCSSCARNSRAAGT